MKNILSRPGKCLLVSPSADSIIKLIRGRITYESWHFRYVGRQAAQYIWENDLCLEEFLELVSRRQSGAP